MVAEVKMPALSPTMTEGKIVTWNKKEGDNIAIGDVILEVETDKAVMEVEAQNKGVLGKILCQSDTTIAVGTTIALILEKGETADVLENYQIQATSPTNEEKGQQNTNANDAATNNADNGKQEFKTTETTYSKDNKNKVFASPLAKNIAKINNIDITTIPTGSGPNGRIIKADVEALLTNGVDATCSCSGRNPVEYTDITPSSMRRTIARRLLDSKQQVPHWYLKITADMENFMKFRTEVNQMAKIIDGKPEYKISANDIIIMAVAKAIRKNPTINSTWIDGTIRQYNNIDVSVAVAVHGGIFTPTIKNADQLGLLNISKEVKRLIKKAQDGKLMPQEFQGGSVSISNLGMYGVQEFYSIINQPQSCILAIGEIHNSVVATSDGNIVVRPTCTITISADHRVIDGAILALFANDLKKMLENPAIMAM